MNVHDIERRRQRLWLGPSAVLALVAQACGSGGPTPTQPISALHTTLVIRSGETDMPVSGAVVIVGGIRSITDAQGVVSSVRASDPTTPVDVDATGFLERRTWVESTPDGRLSLWPRTSPTGLSEDLTRDLVYPGRPMVRVGSGATRVSVALSTELQRDPMSAQAFGVALDRMSAATGGFVAFSLDGGGDVVVSARVDPTDPEARSGATTKLHLSGYEVQGGAVIFESLRSARLVGVVLHELGHVFGLGHSTSVRDLMGPGPGDRDDFSPREKLIMKLMLQRRAGNRFPDSDR